MIGVGFTNTTRWGCSLSNGNTDYWHHWSVYSPAPVIWLRHNPTNASKTHSLIIYLNTCLFSHSCTGLMQAPSSAFDCFCDECVVTLKCFSCSCYAPWPPHSSDTHRMASCTCWTATNASNRSRSAFRTARISLTWSSPAKRESMTKCWRVRLLINLPKKERKKAPSVWGCSYWLPQHWLMSDFLTHWSVVAPQIWTQESRRLYSPYTSST